LLNLPVFMNKKIISLPLLLASPVLLTSAAQKELNRPNVLIILLDDAGYNDFGFMGSKDLKSPNIDELASQSTLLTNAHVTASVSGPSRAGLLTGRYQQRFGAECNFDDTSGLGFE
jgi:arylsulfatase A-like enzyme